MTTKVYRNPKAGRKLLETISADFRSPIIQVKFCTLAKPFFYPNSPEKGRYSIVCCIDPKEHKDFIKQIQALEKAEGVQDSVFKIEYKKTGAEYTETGNFLMKFQTTSVVPVFQEDDNQKLERMKLEDEFAPGEFVTVIFDIRRYTHKVTGATGFNFAPTSIIYHPPTQ